MKLFVVLLCIFGIIFSINGRPDPTDTYSFSVGLSSTDEVHLYWNFTNETITFEVHAKTAGYIGLGFSHTGGMTNADMIIGWVLNNGTTHFADRHTNNSKVMPAKDAQQDYMLDYGREVDGWTILRFWRYLDTCDDLDWKITDGTVKVIWSLHKDDPASEDNIPYHGATNRGTRNVQLLTHRTKAAPIPSNAFNIDFINTNFTVPSTSTTYWCQAFKVPDFPTKHHVVQLFALVQPGNEALVHHIILYACRHPVNESVHGFAHICYRPNMPEDLHLCNSIVFGWAVGAGVFTLPEHVGMPIGPGSDFNFVWMETHYDNPQKLQGIHDTSGFRLVVTPTLREYDATMLEAGVVSAHSLQVIPPLTQAFTTPGMCSAECLTEAMGDKFADGINLIGVQLHAHLIARGVVVRHFRKGRELPEIQRDDNYDFNFQETRHLAKEVKVLPGDDILVECRYDSRGRVNITWGNLPAEEEMCIAYIMYYPRMNMTTCQTVPRTSHLLTIAGVTKTTEQEGWGAVGVTVREPKKWKNRYFKDVLEKEVDWSNKTIQEQFQRLTNEAGRLGLCRNSWTHIYNKVDMKFLPPFNNSKQLVDPPRICRQARETTRAASTPLTPYVTAVTPGNDANRRHLQTSGTLLLTIVLYAVVN